MAMGAVSVGRIGRSESGSGRCAPTPKSAVAMLRQGDSCSGYGIGFFIISKRSGISRLNIITVTASISGYEMIRANR